MPFFCDLYEFSSSTGDSKTSIPPELIPYTQTLYYNCSTDYGTQDYKELFSAPWSGESVERTANMTLEWSSDIEEYGLTGYDRSTHGGATRAEVDYHNQVRDNLLSFARRLAEGGTDLPKEMAPNQVLSTLELGFGILGWGEEFQKFKNTYVKTKEKIETSTIGSKLLEFIGTKTKRKSTTDKKSSDTNQNANNPIESKSIAFTVNPDNLKATLNSVTVDYGSNTRQDLKIEKSIVCKDSSVQTAAECLKRLASYLAIVAPNFYYNDYNKDNTWSRFAMYYSTPNSFGIQPVETQSVLAGGSLTQSSKDEGQPISFDLFKYRGELQLRQGYSIYRNLVPANVTITASSDMLLLSDDPFQELGSNSKGDKDKGGKLSFVQDKANIQEDPAQKFLDVWKKSNLCRKVTLYGSKNSTTTNTSATITEDSSDQLAQYREGWLFPQWINIAIRLCNIEPYDGFTATQQLFCFADGCIKTNTGG